MCSSNCCFLTCIQVSQEAGQVVWHAHLLKNFPQFIVIHTVKGFGIFNKAEIDVFLELSCFFHDSADVGNFISYCNSRFAEAWIGEFWVLLYYRVRWVQLCSSLSILYCLSLGLEWKLTFSSPVATPEFSKFAGIFIGCLKFFLV